MRVIIPSSALACPSAEAEAMASDLLPPAGAVSEADWGWSASVTAL